MFGINFYYHLQYKPAPNHARLDLHKTHTLTIHPPIRLSSFGFDIFFRIENLLYKINYFNKSEGEATFEVFGRHHYDPSEDFYEAEDFACWDDCGIISPRNEGFAISISIYADADVAKIYVDMENADYTGNPWTGPILENDIIRGPIEGK